jgi:hypothetical protein
MKRALGWIDRLSPGRFLLYLLGLGIGLRVLVLLGVPVQQSSDFLYYTNLGRSIAAGQGYADGGVATAFWPPGWPGFLGLLFTAFGPDAWSGQVANLVLSGGVIALTLYAGERMFGDRRVGRIAAVVVALMPNQIGYVPLLSTEIYYEFLLLLGIILLFRREVLALVAAGAVFGIASLTKAQSPLIPAAVLGFACLYHLDWRTVRRSVGRLLLVYAVMACVIVPWTVRNYGLFHTIIPVSTNGGVTLLTGNNPTAAGDFTPNDPTFTDLSLNPADQVETDRISKQRAVAWIMAHKLEFLALMPRKAWRLWAPDGEAEWLYQAGYAGYERYRVLFRTVRVLNQALYAALLLLALPCLTVLWRRCRARIAPQTGWLLFAYATAISVVFSGQSRFHFSLIPWIAIYAAQTLVWGWGRYGAGRRGVAVA